jgi:hypothetical protein
MMQHVKLTRLWAKDDPFGAELAEITVEQGTLSASGVALGSEPVPYRLEYSLATSEEFVTRALKVISTGAGWRRELSLERDSASGTWSCTTQSSGDVDLPPPGGDLTALSVALDCDLGLSPLTNSMPVLRHALHTGSVPRQIDFLMAWVAVPALSVTPSPQRYTSRGPGIVRYSSLDSDFVADINFDQHGIVLDYPEIARTINSDQSRRQSP